MGEGLGSELMPKSNINGLLSKYAGCQSRTGSASMLCMMANPDAIRPCRKEPTTSLQSQPEPLESALQADAGQQAPKQRHLVKDDEEMEVERFQTAIDAEVGITGPAAGVDGNDGEQS